MNLINHFFRLSKRRINNLEHFILFEIKFLTKKWNYILIESLFYRPFKRTFLVFNA